MHRIVAMVLFSVLLGSAWLAPAGGVSYTFTTFEVPGSTITTPSAINDAGQIVGNFRAGRPTGTGTFHGFLFSGGRFTTIDVPGGGGTLILDINDAGQILGRSANGGAFLLSEGRFTPINIPGHSNINAVSINNAGQIAGNFRDAHSMQHGFVWSEGRFTTFDAPGAFTNDWTVRDINDAGQIVGDFIDTSTNIHGFLFSGGGFTTIDVPGSIRRTWVYSINNAGQMVGASDGSGGLDAFLLSGGRFTTFDLPGDDRGNEAFGINDLGQIVGRVSPEGFNVSQGFLATPVPDGDLDADGDIDNADLQLLLAERNTRVESSTCGTPCDLDGDAVITALDARQLVGLCTRRRCATH